MWTEHLITLEGVVIRTKESPDERMKELRIGWQGNGWTVVICRDDLVAAVASPLDKAGVYLDIAVPKEEPSGA